VRAGDGIASKHLGRETSLRVVDTLLTGLHQPGDSHFELLRAFADETVLLKLSAVCIRNGYRIHEFGDSMLIERRRTAVRRSFSLLCCGRAVTTEPHLEMN